MTLDIIWEKINKAKSIILLTHETPDGDAIGSCLAMQIALEYLGKKSDIIIKEVPKIFDFVPNKKNIITESTTQNYDLAIALDCADLNLLVASEYFKSAKETIVIDHHGSNTMYGDINFVNPVAPACCQILIGMFEYFDIEIDKKLGTCLLTGIITDTGGFKYRGVTAETFEFTAELLQKGVEVSDIYKRVMDTKSKASFELMKKMVNRLELLEGGKVSFSYITINDLKEVNAQAGDNEGLVEMGREIEGVEVAVLLRQREEDERLYKISMRSSEYVNVSEICYLYGGGGHPRAAGATLQGDVEQIKNRIISDLRKVLK